jgi:hypothetical protein
MSRAKKKIDPYEQEAETFFDQFKGFITANFGPRCDTVEEDCAVCCFWDLYDQARDLADING